MSLSKRLLDLELKFMITRVWARHSLSLPGAAPPTPPAATPSRRRLGDPGGGRLPSAATGSAERSGRRKSFPGDEMGPGGKPHFSASILPPARQLGRRRVMRRRSIRMLHPRRLKGGFEARLGQRLGNIRIGGGERRLVVSHRLRPLMFGVVEAGQKNVRPGADVRLIGPRDRQRLLNVMHGVLGMIAGGR